MEEFRAPESGSDLAPIAARDELHGLLTLSGSMRWGVTSGQLLRPLPARRATRVFRVFRAAA